MDWDTHNTIVIEKKLPLVLNWLEHRVDNVLWNKVWIIERIIDNREEIIENRGYYW